MATSNALCNKTGNSIRAKVAEEVLGKTALTMPTGCYLALYTADPGTTGEGGTECSGTNYARIAVTWGSASDAGVIANSADIVFATAGGSWGTIAYGVLKQEASGNGLPLLSFAFDTAKAVANLDTVRVAAGDLSITFA